MTDEDDTAVPIRGINTNVHDMARFLGISNQQMRSHVMDGCPVAVAGGPGRPHTLNSADVVKWLLDRKGEERKRGRPPKEIDENDPRNRMVAATAEKRELELAQLRGEIFYFADLEPFVEDILVMFRGGLLDLPREAAEEFGEDTCDWLRERINDSLSRLADELEQSPRKMKTEE